MSATRFWKAFGRKGLIGGLATIVAWPMFAASPSDQAKLVSADTGFAFSLLKELVKEQPANNVFISPYSISTVLQMMCNGAGSTTRDQMAQVLGTGGLEAAALNQAYKDLNTSVRSAQTNVALNIANAIWYSAGDRGETRLCLPQQRLLRCHNGRPRFHRPPGVGHRQRLG